MSIERQRALYGLALSVAAKHATKVPSQHPSYQHQRITRRGIEEQAKTRTEKQMEKRTRESVQTCACASSSSPRASLPGRQGLRWPFRKKGYVGSQLRSWLQRTRRTRSKKHQRLSVALKDATRCHSLGGHANKFL